MNKRLCIAAAALLIATGATGPAVACGVCIDDKVAAVYDHDVMQQATKAGRLVVFCELSGPYEPQVLAPRGKRAAQALTGVDSKSVRTSDHLPAISFVVDPARQNPDAAVAELRQRLAQDRIVPKLLKIIPGPAL
jgi:hypothetical protein